MPPPTQTDILRHCADRYPRSALSRFGDAALARPWLIVVLTLCLGLWPPAETWAAGQRLTIGIKNTPPFVITHTDGSLTGISIELWRVLSGRLGIAYNFQQATLEELLDGLRESNGKPPRFDAVVAALSTTAEREALFDFTQPYFSTGLTIAVPANPTHSWFSMFAGLFSWDILKILGGLFLLVLIPALLIWRIERHRNPSQFGGTPKHGIGAGIWWSVVTMTTVGYGDKAPTTHAGRIVGIVWMFASLILVSSIIGTITSSFTVKRLTSQIHGPADLAQAKVGVVRNSTGEDYIIRNHADYKAFPTPGAALQALEKNTVQAVVYDQAILRYLAKNRFAGRIEVLGKTFRHQNYAIGLPQGSPLREPLNRALLRYTKEVAWQETLSRYLAQ